MKSCRSTKSQPNTNGYKNGYTPNYQITPKGRESEFPAGQELDRKSSLPRLVVDVHETAYLLSIDEATVYRMIYDRQIPASKVRGVLRIRLRDIENFLDQGRLKDY